ncbi:MAG: indolepyruvate oxidoreductase subunit beta [Desulfobacterota bacterium]|nr:indolepyruvate oxidoreductase subunit beta [Thermodesulfobacteriota bacterium]
MSSALFKDPVNLIITGVGGQGNVLSSQVLGRLLSGRGFQVSIGETYGLSQRGGAVMSQIRLSARRAFGPLIPAGQADIVVGLEPLEVLRTLGTYGQPEVRVLTNNRPIVPINVLSGQAVYPEEEKIREALKALGRQVWWIPASETALQLGQAILTNMVMLGALIGTGMLPLALDDFIKLAQSQWDHKRAEANIQAVREGIALSGSFTGK